MEVIVLKHGVCQHRMLTHLPTFAPQPECEGQGPFIVQDHSKLPSDIFSTCNILSQEFDDCVHHSDTHELLVNTTLNEPSDLGTCSR